MPLTTLAQCETHAGGFSQANKAQFLAEFERTRNITDALRLCGITRGTYLAHLGHDQEFRERVYHVKSAFAWSRVPRLFEIADSNQGASVTANIWLQKVFGGDEFNPDRAVAPSTVNIAFVQADLNPTGGSPSNRFNPSHIIRHSPSLQVVGHRRVLSRSPRSCGCASRGPHKLTCALEGVTKGNVKGSGRLIHGGTLTLPGTPQTAPPKNAIAPTEGDACP